MAPTTKTRVLPSPNPPSREPGAVLFDTDRLVVRRHVPSDAPVLAAAANHPSIAVNLRDRFPSPYTVADAEGFLGRDSKVAETGYPIDLAVLVKPTESAGSGSPSPAQPPLYVGLLGVIPGEDVYYRTWELGYWLTPSAWGRGYGTEAVRGAVQWMFATWPELNRLEAFVYSRNVASAKVLQRAGFRREGERMGAVEKGGEILDELVFGLPRQDLRRSGSEDDFGS